MGQTTGQLIGSILSDKDERSKKERKRANIAAIVSMGIGLTDANLTNKANSTIERLNKSKVTDIAKSSKQYDDAVKLQTVQDSIDQSGGGLNGAKVHFGINAETAFNAKHENVLHLFEGAGLTQANRDMKYKWKNDYIENNLYKRHDSLYKGINAADITQLSKEEFNADTNNYYDAKTRQANDPANRSIIHKGINKTAEVLGFNTKRDRLYEEVLDSEIKLNRRNETIDKYRDVYSQQSFTIPKAYTKNTIMAEKMTEAEFFQAWEGAERNPDQAEYSFQEFVKGGMTYEAYEKVQVGYLAEKSMKDNNRLMEQAIEKRMLAPDYKELIEEDQKMVREIASVEAIGGNASVTRAHYNVRQSINQLIDSGAREYQQLEDDPLTPNVDEAEITSPKYLQAKAWAGAQLEAIRKMTGGVNWNTVRKDWISSSQASLHVAIRDKTTEVDSAIKNTRIPLGTGPDSKLYGQEYLQKQVEDQYSGKENKETRERILDQFAKSNYNLNATNGREDSQPLEDGQPAYDLMMAAQQKYYIHRQSIDMVQQSFIYVAELQKENKRLGY